MFVHQWCQSSEKQGRVVKKAWLFAYPGEDLHVVKSILCF